MSIAAVTATDDRKDVAPAPLASIDAELADGLKH
jgi:hypothetical protein